MSLDLAAIRAAAVPYAAIPSGRLDVHDQHVGLILTGGNVDLDLLPWLKPAP